MSQPQKLNEGVYRQGEQVIVVLPSDNVMIVEDLRSEPVHETKLHVINSSQTTNDKNASAEAVAQVITNTEVAVPQKEFSIAEQWNSLTVRWNNFREFWRYFDGHAACCMTTFKRQFVLPVGELPVRSVCMAVSTGLLYTVLGRRNPNILKRSRNLGLSFVFNGVFWLPELFNPFLFRQQRI